MKSLKKREINMELTNKDYKYFEVAKTVASTSTYERVKIGCIIVLKKHIISVGVNSYKSHPIQKYYNRFRFNPDDAINHTLHAEIQALLMLPKDLDVSDATLYTYREFKDHQLAPSRPCQSCMRMIKDYGIRRICYTTEDGFCEENLEY